MDSKDDDYLMEGSEEIVDNPNSPPITDEDEDVEIEALDEVDQDMDEDYHDPEEPVSFQQESTGEHSVLFNIQEPLRKLKKSLEDKLRLNLSGYNFWLQDSQLLPLDTTLVEQCIQGEGVVQINVDIKIGDQGDGRINIIDVLKPTEDAIEEGSEEHKSPPNARTSKKKASPTKQQPQESSSNMSKWVVDANFRSEQLRLNIPDNPVEWSKSHVTHWIKWTINKFPSAAISLGEWHGMDGKGLCALSHEDFKKKVPIDPGDLVWTHIELLRRSNFVAVLQKDGDGDGVNTASAIVKSLGAQSTSTNAAPRKTNKKPPVKLGTAKFTVMSESALGNRSGNNGQVQLWQFLLELLTDKNHRDVIHWIGDEGEFKLENPERVAELWGEKKKKPKMNYEKLSRALRYYYEGDMISKVPGKRFVYKFVCDLKSILGYSAGELNKLVIEAERRAKGQNFNFF